jgi:3-methyl-2-oxobutanoate hydroxymethyltransferase
MTLLGHDSTLPVTVDEMVMFTQAVRRGAPQALVIADLPFGSYETSDEQALATAIRFAKEGGADAVKLERAGASVSRARAIAAAGIPVVGHIGLTPQSAASLGGFKAQGRTAEDARALHAAALALEDAGCAALVLEAIPEPVAGWITASIRIPTIGIGAGAVCDGQVLVWHDALGLTSGPPRFVKRYADLGSAVVAALEAYAADVRSGAFPASEHTYSMSAGESDRLKQGL